MIGDLLSTVGLILSGHGFVSSIRTGSKIVSIEQRLSEAERHLMSISEDTAFVKSSLKILKDLDPLLQKLACSAELDLKYAAPPERIKQFTQNPTIFGAEQFQPWNIFIRSFGKTPNAIAEFISQRIPILFIDSSGEVKASSLARNRLQFEDIFETTPIASFDPETVEVLSSFLARMQLTKKPGDTFEAQFEEEL